MSDLLPLFDDDDDGSRDRVERNDRRQSMWTLLVVGAFAATVAVLATLLLQSPSNSRRPDNQLAGPSQPVASSTAPRVAIVVTTQPAPSSAPRTSATPSKTATSSAPKSASTSPTAPKPSASQSHSTPPSTPTPTPTHSTSSTPPPSGPCPTRMPCVVAGDGGAVAAMQARVGKPGSDTPRAQACALDEIEDVNCDGAHSSIPEPSQDGAQAVADLLPPGADLGWLGEKRTTSFEVGWAYDPKTQQYFCAFVKN